MATVEVLSSYGYRQQKRRVYLLAMCQALFLSCAVASVSVAAIVGAELAPEPWMSTLPYGMQFAVVILCAYGVSRLMARLGRQPAFLLGAVFAISAGLIGFMAIRLESFAGLIASHVALGLFTAHANYYRFAATDGLPSQLRASAVSLVTAGGVIAGAVAPFLTMEAGTTAATPDFAYSYLLFSGAGLLSVILLLFLPPSDSAPRVVPGRPDSLASSAPAPFANRAGLMVAMYCAGLGYLVMNLLMVQATLVLDAGHVAYHLIGVTIQLHVICMFFPSFFTGRLIDRFGHRLILATGFVLLAISGAVGLLGTSVVEVMVSLVFLGIAWNFLYVGGSAFLTLCHDDASASRIQGINDTAVSALAAIGAFSAGILFHWLGWFGSNLLVFPIALTGLALIALSAPLPYRQPLREASQQPGRRPP